MKIQFLKKLSLLLTFVSLTAVASQFSNVDLRAIVDAGNIKEMQKLMSQGMSVNQKDNGSLMKELIAKGFVPKGHAFRALHWAAAAGNEKFVKFLLKNNADVNIAVPYSMYWGIVEKDITPRYMAVFNGHKKIAKLIKKEGGKISHTMDPQFNTILKPAVLAKQHGLVQEAFFRAISPASGHKGFFRALRLIDAGIDINVRNKHDMTALIRISSKESVLEAVQVLINNKIDLDAQDERGRTAMHESCTKFGEISTLELLLKSGAKHNIKDKDGRTPLDIAKHFNKTEHIKLLEKQPN